MSDADEPPKANCSFTFKRRGGARGGGGGCRRRQAASGSSSSASSGEEQAAVVRVEKRKKINPMIQKSGGVKKFKVNIIMVVKLSLFKQTAQLTL
jgi:hypothetical protein